MAKVAVRTKMTRPAVIQEAATSSQSILTLHDDWDGEGSRGYDEGTFEDAVATMDRIAAALPARRRDQITSAEILPGPDGSIDIGLTLGKRRLLLNIPVEVEEPVLYYGHGPNRSFPIKGGIARDAKLRFLAEWLTA